MTAQPRGLPDAYARRTDPDTSHDAAASLAELPLRRQAVWAVLDSMGGGTDEDIGEQYESLRHRFPEWAWLPLQSASGLRTRRAELVAAGLVCWTGATRELYSGRHGRVWQAVDPTWNGVH